MLNAISAAMVKVFGSSWRTTVGGYIIAILLAVVSFSRDGHNLNLKDPLLWTAVAVAVKGHFEKDKAVTGGTFASTDNDPHVVKQTSKPAADNTI